MWYLYLDESGDLGFDFVNKKPSKFFTICVLLVQGFEANRQICGAVKKTIKRKMNNTNMEIKGSKTSITVKKYFYNKVSNSDFKLYTLTLNKKRVYSSLVNEKERVYNYIARLVIEKIPFEKAGVRVELIADRCKCKPEIEEFNSYIIRYVQSKLDPKVPLSIYHRTSHEDRGLQAVDVFTWGVFRKYEKKDIEWYSVYKDKIAEDSLYLP